MNTKDISNNKIFNQKNGVTIPMKTWAITKANALISAKAIKTKYPSLEPLINFIANDIQLKMNKAILDCNDLMQYATDLKTNGIEILNAEKILNDLLILGKHNNNNNSESKFNYFGVNKTNSMNQFIKFKITSDNHFNANLEAEKYIDKEHIASVKSVMGNIYRNIEFHIEASNHYKDLYNDLKLSNQDIADKFLRLSFEEINSAKAIQDLYNEIVIQNLFPKKPLAIKVY